MATPTDHADSLITQAAPYLDAASLASDPDEKRELFTIGWKIVEPALYGMALRKLNGDLGDRLIRDAMTETATKLWSSIRRGYIPQNGWEAGVYRVPQNAAVNVLKQTEKHRDNPMRSLDERGQHTDDDAQTLADGITLSHDPVLTDDLEHDELRQRLDRAARRARALCEHLPARILTIGIEDQLASTARDLEATPKDVRAALDWIRDNEYALFVVSDQRFVEYVEETIGLTLAVCA